MTTTATPEMKSVTPKANKLPPLPHFNAGGIGTTSTGTNSDDDGFCKTMADVQAFNEKEEQQEAARRAALLPPIEDSNTFLGRPISKPPVLIEGLLKQKRIMILGASSKIGKTWTLINLGVSIASGQPWLSGAV